MILFDIWICISALVDCFGKKKFKIIIWKCQLWWLKICSTVIYADATITTAWFGHIYGQYHKVQYTTYLHIVWCEKKTFLVWWKVAIWWLWAVLSTSLYLGLLEKISLIWCDSIEGNKLEPEIFIKNSNRCVGMHLCISFHHYVSNGMLRSDGTDIV